jgi:putative sterol carrier protein
MSSIMTAAVAALQDRMPGGFDGVAKFVLTGEGAIMADPNGVREGDGEADVTLTAAPEVFKAILDGDLNPTSAFMTGKLAIDGSMGLAMKLASALA